MSVYNKVVWREGLFLRPQHFQQQDRYLERYIETRCAPMRSHAWGFSELQFNEKLLAIGTLQLQRAVGVFPDGTPFRMPDDQPLPLALELGPEVRDQVVSLAVPLHRPGAVDADDSTDSRTIVRHTIATADVNDALTGSAEKATIEVATLRSRLLLASDAPEGYAHIPMVHIVECRADRSIVLGEQFIPTVLDIHAAARLSTFLVQLQGMMHTRGEALAGRVTASGRGGAAEIADFLWLQTINRYEPLIAHLTGAGLVHPEDLYRVLVCAAGDLATLAERSKRPSPFPPYRHHQLRASFDPVIAALQRALSVERDELVVSIPIEAREYGVNVATVMNRSLFGTAVFVLGVRADMPAEEVRRRFPSQSKIGPIERLNELVNLSLPGVPIAALPAAPRLIAFHAGFHYFELDQSSELWQQVTTSGGIGLHVVAANFPGLTMELWAVRGG
jgi:type VI secretion system protein ImpJ